MKILWEYLREKKALLFYALILATINQVFSLLDPQIFRLIVDRFASRPGDYSTEQFFAGIGLLLLASVGVALVSRIAKNFQDYFVNVITQRIGASLYGRSVAHSFSLPYSVFEDQRSGELLQKLQKARTDSQLLITSFINTVFLSVIGILVVVGYAFYVHWTIGLAYFSIIPVLGTFTFYITRRIKEIQKTIVGQTADLAGSTTETLRNVELVKSLGLEDQEINRLNTVNNKILELELRKIKMVRFLSFWQGTVINGMRSLILLLMMWLIFREAISLGEFFSLFVYSFFLFTPLAEFGNFSSQYQETKASLEQLEGVLKIEPEKKPASPVVVPKLEKISFKNVSFAYSSNPEPSVYDINLEVRKGETIAFVGPSGSGKTTLIKLLVGLYKPGDGVVAFNNVDSKRISYEEFRRRVGLVSQETQLFSGTIRENLLFVNPNATDEECLKALEQAAAMSIIERGGQGLETKIGEGGVKISGGERQRLAIARALLRHPELIIFDEATSSLDSLTERSITKTIKDIITSHPHTITVMVAHRLSTIAHADKIFVLEKGRIVEEGDHETLLDKKGLYYAMWREQEARGLVD